MTNDASADWTSKLGVAFDRLRPSVLPPLSNAWHRDLFVIIGSLTIACLALISIVRFMMKVRQIYHSIEPEVDDFEHMSRQHSNVSSYQTTFETGQCTCSQYSCIRKLPCIARDDQAYPYYEQIVDSSLGYSTSELSTSRDSLCVHVV